LAILVACGEPEPVGMGCLLSIREEGNLADHSPLGNPLAVQPSDLSRGLPLAVALDFPTLERLIPTAGDEML
jgi:hypothetical protein